MKNQSPEEKLDINEITMPPKMKRKERPKGTETTAVEIPKKKKLSTKPIPYAKAKRSASLY